LAESRIIDIPSRAARVRFKDGTTPRFLVTVDAEEEFDWGQPLKRSGHSVETVPRLRKFQQFCEGHGVVPVYLVDHPIATSAMAAEILREPLAAGRAEIGVQLHPWVSPPHTEEVGEFNSFAGNLPPELEREKLRRLRDTIEENLGVPPLIYRAGRYGVGPNTAAFLQECGIAIDTSVRANFDYSATGGPNFRDFPLEPWWIDRPGGLMELPLTTVFWGLLRRQGRWLYPRLWRVPQLRGLLARLGLLERIPLTPEGVGIPEALKGIDVAIDDGLPILVFSFHSPSQSPGYTPYVRGEKDLDDFYEWWRTVFACLERRGVRPTSVREIMTSAELD
jgi:hypothetical protein